MTHCSDEDLVLHHYGESREADAHVAACPACATRARELAELLQAVDDDDVPHRGSHYGTEVFYRIRPRLEQRRSWFQGFRWSIAAVATVVLIAAAFVAGRLSMSPPARPDAPVQAAADVSDPGLARRVLLLTVADHLERSDRMLTDIMNTPGGFDLSAEQQWADDLIAANRLYRQDALDADESSLADVLDELERALLDIVHRPADASHADLDHIRQRIDSAALLFKLRVLTNELRQRQFRSDAPVASRSNTPVS